MSAKRPNSEEANDDVSNGEETDSGGEDLENNEQSGSKVSFLQSHILLHKHMPVKFQIKFHVHFVLLKFVNILFLPYRCK